jgi:hypothetical protein
MNFLERTKAKVAHATYEHVLLPMDRAIDYVDEHPSVTYAGLLGLSFAVGIMWADLGNKLDKIDDKLDE